ncbi:hypothetical protein HMPREF9601_02046 [Cutibacterium acnes HL030PA1]|nr:hypothetical protein HMPREF9620_02514 [Cutibacterium acnes HL037PA1]EFT77906.1 hypothetical protein HMPREF9601_02046 [Cutibacterium acnes HL030PA1]EGE71695.1 hypothetical protein HMPREF9344_02535 [Cutibacterium acnes HL097PA1]EGF66204.1 hypothetical protein HMPREF9588_02381 [Cutibacterium acnes HL025PA2]
MPVGVIGSSAPLWYPEWAYWPWHIYVPNWPQLTPLRGVAATRQRPGTSHRGGIGVGL